MRTRRQIRRSSISCPGLIAILITVGLAGANTLSAAAGQPTSRPAADQRGAQGARNDNDLPIRNITLYRSGVGYFERHALVHGDRDVQLRFNVEQINDILKSMVVLDLDGGRIDGVGYGSKAPLERRLGSFAVNVADNPDLATLLNRLRGAQVGVETADGPITGTVIGVETRAKPITDGGGRQGGVVNTPFLNLVTERGIRSVDLTTIASFEILDRDLAAELSRALAALAEQRADRIKSVDLSFAGQGERRIVVAYVHEMPVWKTSYRLVLPDHPTGDQPLGGRDPEILTIQGWAIVENTSDEDWEGVRLSLVAGRPVSFEMDLYEPLFAERPQVPVPTVPGVMPRIYQAAVQEWMQREVQARRRGRDFDQSGERGVQAPAAISAPAEGMMRAEFERNQVTADQLVKYAPVAAAQAGEVGQVFRYQLQPPVSIARQRSAMLPILTSDIEGRRVSIYSRADGAEHPMRGVQLVNTSGLQLMPGPISVFDGPAYAGDAQIGHIPAGDQRLLAYAVDLEVQVVARDDSQSTVHSIRIVGGSIEETVRQEAKTSYTFNNKDAKRPRLLLVEHPRLAGWELAAPAQAAERTSSLYRFDLDIEPGEVRRFEVVQQRIQRQRHAVVEYELPRLLAYARDGKASPEVVNAVRRAGDMQSEINTIKRRMSQIDQERGQIHQEQQRIRQNMQSVGRDSDLYRQYVRRFTEQEERLDQMALEREELQRTQEARQQELEEYIRSLHVE